MTGTALAKTILYWVFRLVLAGVFCYSGLIKLQNPQAFLDAVRTFDILPDPWSGCLTMFLPWMELLAGLGLLLPFTVLGASAGIAAMLLTFLAALGSAWARGLNVNCGCFGESQEITQYLDVMSWRMVGFIMAVTVYWLAAKRTSNPVH